MVIIDHPQFEALYFSEACSFEVPENGEFVITGGWKGSNHHGTKRVQVYTTTGVKEQLPDMNHARHAHGCSYFHDASGKLVKCIEGCAGLNIIAPPTSLYLCRCTWWSAAGTSRLWTPRSSWPRARLAGNTAGSCLPPDTVWGLLQLIIKL